MEEQVKANACPYSGANTSYRHNCDLGSLLVRSASENKEEEDKTVFGDTNPNNPGLKAESRKNRSYQKIKKKEDVVETAVGKVYGKIITPPRISYRFRY